MEHLKPIFERVYMNQVATENALPSTAVKYDDEKDLSSDVTLAAAGGVISKTKRRSLDKTIYEFLSMQVWHNLLNLYSYVNHLDFQAPKPLGISEDNGTHTLHMSYVPGHRIKGLNAFKRNTSVRIQGLENPLSLYSACALHLGALNRIKEQEEIKHGDYDGRHVLFNPLERVFMGVIDVENSYISPDSSVLNKESGKIATEFMKYVPGREEYRDTVEASYKTGRDLVILPEGRPQLMRIINELNEEFGVDFDMLNRKINGVHVNITYRTTK